MAGGDRDAHWEHGRVEGASRIVRVAPLALPDRRHHIRSYANAHQRNRLFSCGENEGTSAKLMEVGDLSCRKNKRRWARVNLFSDHDGSQ